MAFPPPVRVSPSGPLATNRLPDPFAQAAGNVYRNLASLSPVVLQLENADGDFSKAFYCGEEIDTIPAGNVRLPALVPEVELDVGTYLVEVDLHVGFFTSPPSVDAAGGLVLEAQFVDSDGDLIGVAATFGNSPLPIQYAEGEDNVAVVAAKSGKYVLPLNLQPGIVSNVAGVRVLITRVNVSGIGPGGAFTTASGTLEVTRETSVTVRRVR